MDDILDLSFERFLVDVPSVQISEEGAVTWALGAAKELIHRLNIWVNRVYAKVAGLSEKVKAEIELAAKEGRDHQRYVPIPKVHMVAAIAALGAATVGIVKATKFVAKVVESTKAMKDFGEKEQQEQPGVGQTAEGRARVKKYEEAARLRKHLNGKVIKDGFRNIMKNGTQEEKEALFRRQSHEGATPEDLKILEKSLRAYRDSMMKYEETVKKCKTAPEVKAAKEATSEIKLLTYKGLGETETALRGHHDSAESLSMELAVFHTYENYGVSPQVDRMMRTLGLTTTTDLASMSQEGLVEWTKDKASKLWHHFHIKVNEIHAYVVNANPKIKERIAAAKARGPGHGELLPLDAKAIAKLAIKIAAAAYAVKSLSNTVKAVKTVGNTVVDARETAKTYQKAREEGIDVSDMVAELGSIQAKMHEISSTTSPGKTPMAKVKELGSYITDVKRKVNEMYEAANEIKLDV